MLSKFATSRFFVLTMFAICALGEVVIISLLNGLGTSDAEGAYVIAGLLNFAWIPISFVISTWLFSLRWRVIGTPTLEAAGGYAFALSPIAYGLNLWSISPAAISAILVHSVPTVAIAIALGTAIDILIFALLGLLLFVSSKRGRVVANIGVVGVLCLPLVLPLGAIVSKLVIAHVTNKLQTAHAYELPNNVSPGEVVVSPNGVVSVVGSLGPIPADRMGGSDQTFYQFGPDGIKNQVLIRGKYWELHSLLAARDGSVWLVARVPRLNDELAQDSIVCVSGAGKITEFVPPSPNVGTTALAEAPDGAIWFLESQPGRLGEIARSGRVTENRAMKLNPTSIAIDGRGEIWFVAQFDNIIGVIGPGGKGGYLYLPHKDSWPDRITRGPDGAMWFTEYHGNRIGRIDGRGKISEFSIGPGCCAQAIVAGRDKDLWFSDNGDSAVSRITLNGTITRYPIGSPFGTDDIQGLAIDRDGSLLLADTVMSNQPQGYVTRAVLKP